MRSVSRTRRALKWAGNALLVAMLVWTLVPFYWMLATSLKKDKEIYGFEATLVPRQPTLQNYVRLFDKTPFVKYLRNSTIISVGNTLASLLFATLGAYALARLRFPGRGLIARGLVFTYLVPPALLFIPLYRVLAELGATNSLMALFLSYPTFTVPFCTWLLVGFFKSIPWDIEEQAMIDGYSRLGAIWRAVLPLSLPGILTAIVFSVALTLHEFIYALAFTTSSNQKTVSIGVTTELIRGDVFFWQSLMAAAVIVAIPVAFVYNLFLDRFIEGFTLGAVKG